MGERLAAALKDMLAPVGINLDLVPMEASAYQAAVFMGNYETCYVEFQSVPYNPPLVYNLYFITGGSLFSPSSKGLWGFPQEREAPVYCSDLNVARIGSDYSSQYQSMYLVSIVLGSYSSPWMPEG